MLSYSQINLFEQCPMKWYQSYVLKEKEPETPVLKFGSAVHKTLESFLWSGDLNKSIEFASQELPKDEQRRLKNLCWLAKDTVKKELEIDLANLPTPGIQFSNNGIEEKLIYENFIGIIDLIVNIENKLLVIDWKTTSQDYTEHQIKTSDQLICYSWLLNKVYNVIPDKVLYVTLNKKTESCKIYGTTVSPIELSNWENKVNRIRQLMGENTNYKNPNNCIKGWGKCHYYDKCWQDKKVYLPASIEIPKFGGK